MAQKVQVVLVDDIDGGDASQTVSFAIDGTSYEIDLNDAHAAELRDALQPWIAVARKTSTRRAASRGRREDTGKIRAWAKANGFDVSERGRISAQVREAYAKAH
ncbi:histone-like nucleoid-structuring protein Lsr2 [Demequina globuliformis]|uniref:histone-like nucleoid-structuring protein Lsr2 n=1 Tax=Demequina globuliformis TaxID=676202 RepID=UPI000781E76A|nr:Lsr2 family protein [Demequina globuliformis]